MKNKYTGTIKFRGRDVCYSSTWLDSCTFALMLGDGEFVDEDGDAYSLVFEYNIKSKNWSVTIMWEDGYSSVGFLGSEQYITGAEIKEVKEKMRELVAI
jgi:hypothetical protein